MADTTFVNNSTPIVATWLNFINDYVNTGAINITLDPYNADNTGAVDCSSAIAAAWTTSPGVPIYFPPGTYRIDSTLNFYPPSFTSSFGVGPKLFGAGIGKTIFDNRVVSGPMINVDSDGGAHATFQGVLGTVLHGFTVKTLGAPASSTAIKLRTAYLPEVSQVHIIGMSGNGIEIPCTVGDNDGSNMVKLRQVRIENCVGWGIKADGDSGRNEMSFLDMEHCFIQGCGATSASTPPPSGGMIWKGQILRMGGCAFTINENVGLYVPGQAGLGNNVDLQSTTFENNKKRGVYCTGISSFKMRNSQVYNNNTYTATNGVEFDGTTYTVRQVEIDGMVVRATSSNNPYTAFKISGSNADTQSCRVRRVVWDNFDYTGQTRFDGWLFDSVRQDCQLITATTTLLEFKPKSGAGTGRSSPLRLSGGGGGVASTSGEWIEYLLASSGLSISNASLSNSTRYYCYLKEASGVVALELSTTVPVVDSLTGYMVKTGDSTRLYIGSVTTDGAGLFVTSGIGWLNPEVIYDGASSTGSPYYRWRDSTGDFRVSNIVPTSDTDGTVVGTQT